MTENIKLIAERIKELRNISGVSIENIAKDFNMDVEEYKKYESGEVDIPVSFLYDVAHKFNVELTAILTGKYPKLHIYSVARKGKGIDTERIPQYNYKSLAYNFANKKSEPFLVTVEPKDEEKPLKLNSHHGQEFDYVLEGRIKLSIDKHEVILEEGDCIYFDSSYKHGMQALDKKLAKFIAVIIY